MKPTFNKSCQRSRWWANVKFIRWIFIHLSTSGMFDTWAFSSDFDLIFNMIISGVKKYKCTLCDDRFTSKGTLKQHIENKHQRKIYKCSICSASYSHRGTLIEHMNSHTKQNIFKCNFCSKEFLNGKYLKNHLKEVHTKLKPFKCDVCSLKFIRKDKLVMHIKCVHEKKTSYTCSLCSKTLAHKWSLHQHMRRHVGGEQSKCPYCPFKADGSKDLKRHLKLHFADEKYKCSECTASFTHRRGQRKHLESVHKKDPGPLEPLVYKCSKCEHKYKCKASLQRHELTHDQIKNFQCIICVAKFYSRTHLKRHMSQHGDGSGQFLCTICNADFKTHQVWSQHNVKWHGLNTSYQAQTYKCKYCIHEAQGTSKRHSIIKHQKLHMTASDKHFCKPCKAKFSSNYALSKHNKLWHNENLSLIKVESTPRSHTSVLDSETLLSGQVTISDGFQRG